jgi:hypothetical protein
MPTFGAAQTPISLTNGERVAVLNAENLANGALTMAINVIPEPTNIMLAIYNNCGQSVSLVASPDLTSTDFLPVYNEAGNAVTIANGQVSTLFAPSGLNYALKAGAAITAGTIWISR